MTEERRREMPQRVHALRVAPIFGPRYVAKLARSTAATLCAWLLAIFRKLTATWHAWVFQQSPRAATPFRPVISAWREPVSNLRKEVDPTATLGMRTQRRLDKRHAARALLDHRRP